MLGKIYGLVCPKTNQIRYVGQTKGEIRERMLAHVRESRYPKERYTYKEHWIRGLLDDGLEVGVVLIEETEIENLDTRERFWIATLPNLTNLLNGGTSGYTYPAEVRQMMSEQKKGHRNPMYGRRYTHEEEVKKRISETLRYSEKLKQSRRSSAYRERISDIQSLNTWVVLDEHFKVVGKFRNARTVTEYFAGILGKKMTIGNIKNARRFRRPVGKQLEQWYYVSYEDDCDDLELYVRGGMTRSVDGKNTL